jgi:hypothetical protein
MMTLQRALFILALAVLGPVSQVDAETHIFSAVGTNNRPVFCSYDYNTTELLAGRVGTLGRFVSFNHLIQQARKQAKRKSTPGIKKKLTMLQRLNRQGLVACRNALRLVSEAPRPGVNPSDPSPPSCNGNFDAQGNTCPDKFLIPSGLVGNISRGKSIHTLRCSGCHMERTHYQFDQVVHAVSNVRAMNGILAGYETEQAVADLVAYLNRFNS